MPKALPSELREIVKALYIQGFTATQIAQKQTVKVQTVQTWAARGKWTGLRDRVQKELASSGKASLAVEAAEMVVSESVALRHSLGSAVKRDLRWLDTACPTVNPLQTESRYARIEPAVRVAARVFGWDQDQAPSRNASFTQLNVSVTPGAIEELVPVKILPLSEGKPAYLTAGRLVDPPPTNDN